MRPNPFHLIARHFLAAASIALLATSCDRQGASTSQGEAPRPHEPRATKVFQARETHPGIATFNWNVGDISSFNLEVAFAFGKPAGGVASLPDPANGGLVVRGIYHLGVMSVEGDTVTLAAAMSDGVVLCGGQRSPIFENLVNSTPGKLTLATDGTIKEITFPGEVSEEDRQLLRAIFGWEFQARPGETTWQSSEAIQGGEGSFLVTYSANGDGSVSKVRGIHSGSAALVPVLKTSRFVGKVGRLWLDSLRGEESAVLMCGGKSMGESLVRVALARSEATSRPAHFESMLHTLPGPGQFTAAPNKAGSVRASASEQTRIERLREKYRSVPFEGPFRALQKVAGTGSHADAMAALCDLRDMLTVRPDCAAQVAESLKSEMSPDLSGLLAHALELANTEATQGALAAVLSHPGDYSPTVLAQAIVAAGGLGPIKDQNVSASLMMLVEHVGNDPGDYNLNDTALFSLGSLSIANPELREPLISALAPRLVGDSQDTRTALLALANGRIESPEIVGRAENLLSSAEPKIRTAALAYFEQLPQLTPGQTKRVSDLLNDSSSAVQLQAVAALAPSDPREASSDNLAALQKIAVNSAASADVRTAARSAITRLTQTASQTSRP